jgi:cytochrome c biogenesis protein CcdA
VDQESPGQQAFITLASLSISLLVFAIALKYGTNIIQIPLSSWKIISGIIFILFGLTFVFPKLWEFFSGKIGLNRLGQNLMQKSRNQNSSVMGNIILGLALGPSFSGCSPAYGVLLAYIYPLPLSAAISYILIYILGLLITLAVILKLGDLVSKKFKFLIDPTNPFRKFLGVVFIAISLWIIFKHPQNIECTNDYPGLLKLLMKI